MKDRQNKQVIFNGKELNSLLLVAESYKIPIAVGCLVIFTVFAAFFILRILRIQRVKQNTSAGIESSLTEKTKKVVRQKKNRRNAKSKGKRREPVSKIPNFEEGSSLDVSPGSQHEDGRPTAESKADSLLEFNKNIDCDGSHEQVSGNQNENLNDGSLTLDDQLELNSYRESMHAKVSKDNVNEFVESQMDIQGCCVDCYEHKSQEDEDNVEFIYKKSLKDENPRNNQEHIADGSQSDMKKEQEMEPLKADMTCAEVTYKKMKICAMGLAMKDCHEGLSNGCQGPSISEQQCSDLPNGMHVKRHYEEEMVIQRERKCDKEKNGQAIIETEIKNDTTINSQENASVCHPSKNSQNLSDFLNDMHRDKGEDDHYETENNTPNLKCAKVICENSAEKYVETQMTNHSTTDMKSTEETTNNHKRTDLSNAENKTDVLRSSLNDLPGGAYQEFEKKPLNNSRSSLIQFESLLKSKSVGTVQPMSHTVKVSFCVHYVTHSPSEGLAVTGNKNELGSWKSFIQLQQEKGGYWSNTIVLPVDSHVEWKFVLVENGKISLWEECGNRSFFTGQDEEIHLHKCWGHV
ncbi:uncharacterized protein stbd1 [Paramormyrops kingsleyae]|uniref:Starch-binding domain-containing protein 1 n=1 Tax=Paramormyrops kingsleyae TaxID=1676925 RepID=A0A3B3S4T0_9TELE|nr:starch-binding domain-containing protein 1 [Paramormyrops kingsleyae]